MLAEEGASSADSATHNARARCVELSLRVINHLETFDADITDLPEHEALLCWQFLGKAHFDLILHAAYNLCLELQRIHSADSSPPPYRKATIIHTLNRTLTGFLEKDPNLNIHIKDLVRLALVIQYVRTGSSVDRKEELMRQALDRVIEACTRRASAINGTGFSTNGCNLDTTPSDLFDWDLFGFDLNSDFTQHMPYEVQNLG